MNKERIIKFFNKYFIVLTGFIIGIIIFLLIYGYNSLDVQYDKWIYNGYIEHDVAQHYAGWVNFRNSDWSFPIGKMDIVQHPDGTMISYTDSIPLFAIIFKLIRNILPETFQYFGIYILLCFILQAIAAGLLAKHFTDNKINIILIQILFTISTIMIERAFRHTALASHWLILFSLYLYFKSKKENYSFKWQFLLLSSLTILIHPYFIPMVLGIIFANLLDIVIHKKNYIKSIAFLLANMAVIFIIGCIIGVFGVETVESAGGGFGYYSMNINAIINPISKGIESWSVFLKARPQILGNYDGFNYLGVGTFLIGVLIFLHYLINNRLKDGIRKIRYYIKNNLGLSIVLLVLYIFSISNVVTFDDRTIFSYPLPETILKICNIFRASSRMFYPVFYMIFLTEVVYIVRKFTIKNASILLVIFIAIQVVDIMPALKQKHEYFAEKVETVIFDEPIWNKVSNKTDKIYVYPNSNGFNRYLAVFCAKNKLLNNIDIGARNSIGSKCTQDSDRIYNELLEGKNPLGDSEILITDVTTNPEFFENLKQNLNSEITIKESLQYKIFMPKAMLE